MQSDVINIRTQAITDVEAKARGFGGLTKVLLFIADEVFGTGNYASALNALDSLGK